MDRKGLIESRLSSLTAEDDQDSRRFFDQQTSTVDMTAAALLNCEFRNLAIDTIIAERTHVNHVLTDSCRTALLDICSIGMENSIAVRCAFGAVQANAAKIIGMEIRGCRIDYLNCRDAICRDIMFRDCEIGELDGNGARLSRIAFTGTRIDVLTLQHAICTDVDLRGARLREIRNVDSLHGTTMSLAQITDLSAVFARSIGIRTQ
ncbi:pentapeptide repeat-containing protein [Bifidobacterium animalis subsp. animalis]|nr:pentapeptide repeat-containing protein [Bifidobacterium animalis]MCR1995864.1 pentapeptide repeat-containing protein [Bifidobacterium animalis subsp. animalis]